jgi:DNA relaxase NicK
MKPKIIEAAADYVTASGRGSEAERNITGAGELMLAQQARLGNKPKAAKRQGYDGWRCGSLFYGHRADGMLFELSGPAAHQACENLDWGLVRASRLDIQVTVEHSLYRPDVARELSDWVERERWRMDPEIPVHPRFHAGHGEGDGFTIGKRGSPRYGRIYDKQQESGDPLYARCWRWEVEYRKVAARAACDVLDAAGWHPDRVAGMVGRQFRDWHIIPPFELDAEHLRASIGRRDHDSERTLKWLGHQVRPSIDKLLATVDRQTVLEALGLDGRF